MLLRTNPLIQEKIIRFTPDLESSTIEVVLAVGSVVNGNFLAEWRRPSVYIGNEPAVTVHHVEALLITNGEATLSYTPSGAVSVEGFTEGIDYLISGAILTSITIPNETTLNISYPYIRPANNRFDRLAMRPTTSGTIYSNISEGLWEELIDMGAVSGSYI